MLKKPAHSILFIILAASFGLFPGVLRAQEADIGYHEYQKTADCVSAASQWYGEEVGKCLAAASDSSIYEGLATAEEIQAKIAEAQQKQRECYRGEILQEYDQRTAACYEEAPLGNVWDLPVLKDALKNQMQDYQNLTPESSKKLSACIQEAGRNYDLYGEPTAEAQQAISDCFGQAGLTGFANLYGKTSMVVDCAKDSLSVNGVKDISTLMTRPSPEEEAYIEQCVIKRTAPVVAGIAVLNIPFASGFGTVLLYLQFLFTQPILLLMRRKHKFWGRVFDSTTSLPVDLSAVRLFDNKKNILIKSMVTGKSGRYLFLPNPGEYRIEVDKSGYEFPSSLADKGAEPPNYLGEPIPIKAEEDSVDKQVPIDPAVQEVSLGRLRWKRWKYRLTFIVALLGPALSLLAAIFVRKWWVLVLLMAHIILFFVFVRLNKKKQRQFGVVADEKGKALLNVRVSLFAKEYGKLVKYEITDVFGRFFFPSVKGEYLLRFEKKNFKQENLEVNVAEEEANSFKIDVTLKKEA